VQLPKTVENRGVGGAHRVKQIAGNHDEVRLLLEDVIDGALERLSDVGLALIRAFRRLPIELAKAEVEIGEVRELH
jgi:hypothetical protein